MVVPLAASLGAVGGAVVVCAAVTALLLWRRRDWRRRQAAELQQGKGLQPPGPGPATTLAVTDVQVRQRASHITCVFDGRTPCHPSSGCTTATRMARGIEV